ncbi:hypothetical protein ISS07_03465 [Candidatus Woesearchaeota archaeon]|nr:hypothetical protein [Candidatus Woesearchaeota archaeon]
MLDEKIHALREFYLRVDAAADLGIPIVPEVERYASIVQINVYMKE